MIKLEQSIPYITSEEREAFSHDQVVFHALQILRSYGFNVDFEGVKAPKWPNDAKFECDNPGQGAKAFLDEINRS